jgi:alkanesulfonate monooxygenase SsuD/methylene tetrahydromethanopterin reductase-like flavin-dependent oxidoreductase (luciferase family)
MKVDATLPANLHDIAELAPAREAVGYSGIWTAETSHDPFLPLALAAEHTT